MKHLAQQFILHLTHHHRHPLQLGYDLSSHEKFLATSHSMQPSRVRPTCEPDDRVLFFLQSIQSLSDDLRLEVGAAVSIVADEMEDDDDRREPMEGR